MNVFVAGATGAIGTTLAKRELGWQPRWSTWRVGFAKGLDG